MPDSKQEQVYNITDSDDGFSDISKAYLISKRCMDLMFALIGVVFLCPVYLIIALLIKIEDKEGNIIFRQERVGKNGKLFYMYKFRSMVSNAEELKATLLEKNEVDGPVFKIKNDPRITKIGKLLRKTSLDELPQLFNVIKGDMSLVGPRPPLLEEVLEYTNYEKIRLSVTPGLTCYWQVGGRSNLSFEEWVELDLKYIRERNIYIDIKLIAKTILVLFGSKGAF
ncbi:sugar transferase [Terribacillus saccharophilus]|nr:sugar transferase [Terribacillus saccharophilus]